MLEDLTPERLEHMRGMLLAMDPPRHNDYRRPMVKRFMPKVMEELEDRIRAITKEILARAAEMGDVEFVHDVTSDLPTNVIGELVGLPEEDWQRVHHMAELNTHGQDPDYVPDGDGIDPGNGSMDMAIYGMQHAATWRTKEPQDDLTTYILTTGVRRQADVRHRLRRLLRPARHGRPGHHADHARVGPRRAAAAPGAAAGASRRPEPDPRRRRGNPALRQPVALLPADRDGRHVLNGTEVKAGDKVAMYYTSANRDEDVFDRPQEFDIHRKPNPHLSFGIAEHFCLGVHLARLEGKIFFEELLGTFPTIEATGPAVRTRSNLNNALKKLPIRLAT